MQSEMPESIDDLEPLPHTSITLTFPVNLLLITLPMLRLPKYKEAKFFENHPNPVMLVFIGKLSLRTLR